MNPLNADERARLLDLLADEAMDQLDPADRAELESLAARAGGDADLDSLLGELIVALDDGGEEMPDELRGRVIAQGRAMVDAERDARRGSWRIGQVLGLAAAMALVAVSAVAVTGVFSRQRALEAMRVEMAQMSQRAERNEQLLADARSSTERLREALASRDDLLEGERRRLAEAAEREVDLAQRLATATADLDRARLAIAKYEEPVDPAVLAGDRRKLLEVPDTIRIAWQPFDLPDAPAEQRSVQGDVVWNDKLQQGYLRFVGLRPNDPAVEQYQVWIIDERGMEQKVSGGVFNATADGEVIVPLEPGIDVRRVALFAVTVEEPGGTWVPDLRRRVVVAPREG